MANYYLHSPADVVRQLLINLGLGIAPVNSGGGDWQVNVGKERDSPDNALTVYDTDGRDDGRSMPDGRLFYHHGFQVRVRAADQATAGWLKADSIRRTLAEQVRKAEVVIVSSFYVVYSVAHIGDVLSLGWDSPNTKRSLFTLNALMTYRQVA